MRLGVLGGTFDPVHLGHLILAQAALEQLRLDKVRFVPAGDPWRKALREVTPAAHRVRMVELAIADNAAFQIDKSEIARKGPTYTSETLREIRMRLSAGDELYFLLGADALHDMPHWKDPVGVVEAARLAVVSRNDESLSEAPPFVAGRVDRVEMPYVGISSTDIRARVAKGLSIRYLVPPAVEAYIREQGLYRGSASRAG